MILRNNKDAFGYLVDFSEPMLLEAKKRLADYTDRIEIINSDISSSDWQGDVLKKKSTEVDAVISGYCIHHLPLERKYQLYSEIYDMLSSNGIFINLEHVSSSSDWGEMVNDELFIDAMEVFAEKTGR